MLAEHTLSVCPSRVWTSYNLCPSFFSSSASAFLTFFLISLPCLSIIRFSAPEVTHTHTLPPHTHTRCRSDAMHPVSFNESFLRLFGSCFFNQSPEQIQAGRTILLPLFSLEGKWDSGQKPDCWQGIKKVPL